MNIVDELIKGADLSEEDFFQWKCDSEYDNSSNEEGEKEGDSVKHDTELGEITENDENADPNIVEEEKKSE
jgi:hypothetical protein